MNWLRMEESVGTRSGEGNMGAAGWCVEWWAACVARMGVGRPTGECIHGCHETQVGEGKGHPGVKVKELTDTAARTLRHLPSGTNSWS